MTANQALWRIVVTSVLQNAPTSEEPDAEVVLRGGGAAVGSEAVRAERLRYPQAGCPNRWHRGRRGDIGLPYFLRWHHQADQAYPVRSDGRLARISHHLCDDPGFDGSGGVGAGGVMEMCGPRAAARGNKRLAEHTSTDVAVCGWQGPAAWWLPAWVRRAPAPGAGGWRRGQTGRRQADGWSGRCGRTWR